MPHTLLGALLPPPPPRRAGARRGNKSCLGSPTSKLRGEHNDVRNAELPAPRGRPHVSFGVNNAV